MTPLQKRSISLMVLILLTAACNTTTPVQIPTQLQVNTIPPTEAQKFTPTLTDTPAAISTRKNTPSPTLTLVPSLTRTPLGGSGVILFGSNRSGVYSDLYLLDNGSGKVSRLTSGESNIFPGPFSPNGTRILFTGFSLMHSYVGMAEADGSGAVDLSQRPDSDEGFPTWSPDGEQIAFTSRRDGNNEIYVMLAPLPQAQVDENGSNVKRLTFNDRDDFAPAWSPDGTRIAFVSDRDNATGINNLYIMNADGTGIIRLTHGSEIDFAPAWSPDGKKIAFRSHHDGAADIYTINADGSGMVNLTNHPAEDWAPAWSPDGELIAFQTDRDGNWEIYVMRADGSEAQNITQNPADDQMPYWKP